MKSEVALEMSKAGTSEVEVVTHKIDNNENCSISIRYDDNNRSSAENSRSNSGESDTRDTIDREVDIAGCSSSLNDSTCTLLEDQCMTINNPPTNKWRVIACFMWGFALGYSDAVPGAILPTIEAYYNINYAVVSCLWIGNACGFIFVASLSHKIQPWFGKRWSLVLSTCLSTTMYILASTGTVFPVIVVGFFLGGMGGGIGVAQTNVFLARFKNKSTLLSIHHGSYGIVCI